MAKAKREEGIVLKPRKKYSYKPNPKIFYDTIIIGGGVAGFAAAMYAGRLGLKTLIIGEDFGGTIKLTHVVENYPGFISLTGEQLAKRIENHARDYDIDILNAKVKLIKTHKKAKRIHFKVLTADKTFMGKTIILATGSELRKLKVPGEKEYENRGVSYCGLCDGPLYKNKIVAVVGGSDSAAKEALLLTEYAKKVFIIYRKEKIRAEPINLKRVNEKIKKGKIEIINNTNVVEIKGDKFLSHVIFDKPYKGKKEFKLDGLFIDIGHIPLSYLVKDIGVKLNKKGQIIINRNSETNVPGVYAAGDVTDTEFKQAITGVAEGITAVYHAYAYVNKGEYVLPREGKEIGKGRKKKR